MPAYPPALQPGRQVVPTRKHFVTASISMLPVAAATTRLVVRSGGAAVQTCTGQCQKRRRPPSSLATALTRLCPGVVHEQDGLRGALLPAAGVGILVALQQQRTAGAGVLSAAAKLHRHHLLAG